MNRKKDVGSVYGRPDRICYEYIKNMKKYFEEEYNVLILDDKMDYILFLLLLKVLKL